MPLAPDDQRHVFDTATELLHENPTVSDRSFEHVVDIDRNLGVDRSAVPRRRDLRDAAGDDGIGELHELCVSPAGRDVRRGGNRREDTACQRAQERRQQAPEEAPFVRRRFTCWHDLYSQYPARSPAIDVHLKRAPLCFARRGQPHALGRCTRENTVSWVTVDDPRELTVDGSFIRLDPRRFLRSRRWTRSVRAFARYQNFVVSIRALEWILSRVLSVGGSGVRRAPACRLQSMESRAN